MRLALASLCFCVLAPLPVTAADQFVGGPFVVNVTGRSATVAWVVQRANGTLYAQKSVLTDLEPGKTYPYTIKEAGGATGSFKTAPARPMPFEFVVYGDTRTRHDMHRRVVEAVLKYSAPDFVLHTGDLVADGANVAQWPVFFGLEKDLLRKVAFFPALGNHERNDPQFYEFFQVGKPYYSFDWGNAHFIVLNSDIGNAASNAAAKAAFWDEQTRWLEADLQKSQRAAFRFLTAHHPPFTAVARRQGDNPEMTALVPMFEKYRLNAGFFGHDHNYQHYLKSGVHYVITGGGGAPLYDVNTPPAVITKKVVSTEHFTKISVNADSATLTALGLDGSTIEKFEIPAAAAK